jgi:hypothetical protein
MDFPARPKVPVSKSFLCDSRRDEHHREPKTNRLGRATNGQVFQEKRANDSEFGVIRGGQLSVTMVHVPLGPSIRL